MHFWGVASTTTWASGIYFVDVRIVTGSPRFYGVFPDYLYATLDYRRYMSRRFWQCILVLSIGAMAAFDELLLMSDLIVM